MEHAIPPNNITIGDLIELSPFGRWSCKIKNDYSKKSRSYETGGGWFLVIGLKFCEFGVPPRTETRLTLINIHTLGREDLSSTVHLAIYEPQIISHIKG